MRKQIQKIKGKIINIILFPIRIVITPIYNLYEKYKSKKKYSYKTIKKLVQYCIDYHLNNDNNIYVTLDDWISSECEDSGIYSYSSLCDISWGWSGEHKRVKHKLNHIYFNQKEEYIKVIKELCGTPLSDEEKKKEFTGKMGNGKPYLTYIYYRIQDKEICKISNMKEVK